MSDAAPPTPDRSVVIAPNWIGDAVMSQPMLALLRARCPGTRIDVIAAPHVAPVYEAMSEVTEVLVAAHRHGSLQLREKWALARELRARRYARAFVLPNSMKSAIAPWLAGIPERIGHRGEARRGLLNRVHVRAALAGHDGGERAPMVPWYAQLALPPGAPLPEPLPRPVLAHDAARERRARERAGLRADERLLVLAPGAEYGEAKRWPVRHYAALAAMLSAEWPEAAIVLLGSAKERPLATEITALSGQPLRNLCGETTLGEAIALIAQAWGVVSNDSGLMHVAAAYGRPQVAVFGSSDPRHTPPHSPNARIEWLGLECSPCFQRTCPLGHLRCLNDLPPTRVFTALQQAMRAHATP